MTVNLSQTNFLIQAQGSMSSGNVQLRVTYNIPFKDCPQPGDHSVYYNTT